MVQGVPSAQVLDSCWGEGVDNSLFASFDTLLTYKLIIHFLIIYAINFDKL